MAGQGEVGVTRGGGGRWFDAAAQTAGARECRRRAANGISDGVTTRSQRRLCLAKPVDGAEGVVWTVWCGVV